MSFASDSKLAMLSPRNALGVPSTRFPIDGTTFVSYVIPPLVCYFVAAMLAVTPQTPRTLRLSFCPLVALLAFRAALSVDLSSGEIGLKLSNSSFVCLMLYITSRPLGWAIAKGPLVRHLRPANSSPSIIMDAFDLATNFRGHGWDWSYYQSYVPRETRPTNRAAFVSYAFFSAAAHALVCSVFHRATVTLVMGVGSNPQRQTIFDDTLPVLVRYFRASLVFTFTATWIYTSFQVTYDLCTILGVLIFRQDPIQWPPAFDAPWRATSLIDFWGRRWHQFLRHTFLLLGYPLFLVLGRAGIVIGAFLASVLFHYAVLVVLDSQVEIWWMLAGFGMMLPGIFAERAFLRLTGRRVSGILGWVWTMSWLLLWGTVIVEGLARGGVFVCSSLFGSASPLKTLVERLTVDFDAWLHTL